MSRVPFKLATALSLGAIAVVNSAALVQAQSRSDWLSSSEVATYRGVLYEGEVVFAGCDDDCTDLDMNLYDALSDDLVDSDLLEDASRTLRGRVYDRSRHDQLLC